MVAGCQRKLGRLPNKADNALSVSRFNKSEESRGKRSSGRLYQAIWNKYRKRTAGTLTERTAQLGVSVLIFIDHAYFPLCTAVRVGTPVKAVCKQDERHENYKESHWREDRGYIPPNKMDYPAKFSPNKSFP